MRTSFALASFVLALAACGDNVKGTTSTTDASATDAAADAQVDAPPDANCPARAVGALGGPCTANAQCDSTTGSGDGFCLHGAQGPVAWPDEGYCINTNPCANDTACGAGNVCATINDPGGAFTACLPACGVDACACPNNQLCGDVFAGSTMNKSACLPGNASAHDGDPCVGFADCNESSICEADGAEHPGGQCLRIGCTIGDDATCAPGGDGHCINPGFVTAGTGCVDSCQHDADCRVAEGYRCFDGGADGKYCRHPEAGDACGADADCGDASIWTCRTGAGFTGGYCTPRAACSGAGGTGCSSGSSVCYDPPGAAQPYCVDRCTGAGQGTCRTSYTCTSITANASGCL